jgi:serine/threonine-protein kinase
MAPETLRGEIIDARADQFGWGVMAYFLVTGRAPWRDTDAMGVISQILSEAPAPPPEVDEALPAGVSGAIVRALSKQREARFGTMAELLEAWETTAPRRTRRRRAGIVSLALVSVGVGLVLVALRRGGPHPDALVGAAPAPPRATTLADLPVPATTVADARTEYVAGMQMMRDDNTVSALHHFERAAQLDPAMTMAHLRVAVLGEQSHGGGEQVRTEYGKAVALRGGLGQRDAALMNALEPLLGRAAPDEPEGLARLRAVASQFPLDEEIAVQIAIRVMGKPGEGSMAARHATELDPSDASAWELLGRNLALEGDIVAGRAALDRCAGISPASADCLNWIAFLDGDAGRCAEMERTARREADRDPKFGNWNLADALVALGRSDVAVREVIARLLDALPPEEASIRKGLFEASLAALQGRFDVTLARLDEADRASASSPAHRDELDGFAPAAAQRIKTLLEIGDERGARDVAGALVDRLDVARQTSRVLGDDGVYLWVLRAAGVPLDPARRDWVSAALASATPRGAVWLFAWANPATTRADAEDALSALGGKDGLELPRGAENMMSVAAGDGPAGNVLLLAGRATEAIPFLRRASASCLLPLEAPFELIHARLELATALERTGDTEGACAVYGELIERLGHATPRSVSAEEARVAAARLRCGRARDAGGGG